MKIFGIIAATLAATASISAHSEWIVNTIHDEETGSPTTHYAAVVSESIDAGFSFGCNTDGSEYMAVISKNYVGDGEADVLLTGIEGHVRKHDVIDTVFSGKIRMFRAEVGMPLILDMSLGEEFIAMVKGDDLIVKPSLYTLDGFSDAMSELNDLCNYSW